MGVDHQHMGVAHPTSSISASKSDIDEANWPAHLEKGDLVQSRLDCVRWTARAPDGEAATVLLLPPELKTEKRKQMVEPCLQLLTLQGQQELGAVLEIREVDSEARWVVYAGSNRGDTRDLHCFGWHLARKLEFFQQVVFAIDALHANGMVHGSLAPWNIWLDDNLSPHLGAIGLANGSTQRLRLDSTRSEAAYLAPEHGARSEPLGVPVDIFALGQLLHFLLRGSDPPAEHGAELASTPAELSRIIRRCTLGDPEERYRSARDISRDIARYGDRSDVGLSVESALRSETGWLSALTKMLGPRDQQAARLASSRIAAIAADFGDVPAPGKSAWTLIALTVFLAFCVLFTPWVVFEKASAHLALDSGSTAEKSEAVRRLLAAGERNFDNAQLANALLAGLNLGGTSLRNTNLTKSELVRTNLSQADLSYADLGGADLAGANLTEINGEGLVGLEKAHCDDTTTLPEGWSCSRKHPQAELKLKTVANSMKKGR